MWYFNWCLLLLVFDYRNFERQKLIWSFLLVIFNNKLLYWFGIIAWNKTSIKSNFILSCSLYRSLHLHPLLFERKSLRGYFLNDSISKIEFLIENIRTKYLVIFPIIIVYKIFHLKMKKNCTREISFIMIERFFFL